MKIELGGGDLPRGDGFLNVDAKDIADIQCDFDIHPWPFADESIDEVYSSHCIEHVKSGTGFFREIARICRVGALVEIRCPDLNSEMIMVEGHRHIFTITCVRHIDHVFPERCWAGRPRRLKLLRYEQHGDDYWLPLAREDWPDKSDEWLMRWVPRCCHENRFYLEVQSSEIYGGDG